MNNTQLLILVLVILAVLMVCYNRQSSEGYGVPLGQLAPYRKQYGQCLDQCNREDPGRRLLPQTNVNCDLYCNSVLTDAAERGIPPSSFQFSDSTSQCKKSCADPSATENEKRKCISMCFGRNEVSKWCKELWCPYSTLPEGECIKQCTLTNLANTDQVAWTWGVR